MIHSYISVRSADNKGVIEPRTSIVYSSSDMAKIYGFPSPTSENIVVGVISLGGGLFGTVGANGVLTNGDVQKYWTSQGISAENHPTVVIVGVDGSVNTPSENDGMSTLENTIDVETVGSCCPTSKLTIIMYIGKNSETGFYNVFNHAINTPIVVNQVSVKPTIISCSWGLPELYVSPSLLTNLNNLLNTASQRGINVCVASGDYGSSNGAPGLNVDFPGSSPFVVCCGGTSLRCLNKVYDASTIEIVWNNSSNSATGGGISKVYNSPSYQSSLSLSKRAVPDIALNADNNTGVRFLLNDIYQVVGGTSIAAPAFAAFLACCNTKTFINPLLYSYPSDCFYDITVGNNGAYAAGVGYDKCTGLGSINGKILSSYITQKIQLATSISISPSSVTISTISSVQLYAVILPINTTDKTVSWVSSNTAVATINPSGIVTPISNGTTNITVTAKNGKSSTISITVFIPIRVSSISASVLLSSTTPVQLNAAIQPLNPTNSTITWSSSNPSVATVSSSGLVTAKTNGNTVITVTAQDNNLSSAISITVLFPPPPAPAPAPAPARAPAPAPAPAPSKPLTLIQILRNRR